ncbi:MAG: hypothetical protein KC636_28445, partial [Myxococcales bacterium]|nr:hypothetical protein [Myxococcales bacterium]
GGYDLSTLERAALRRRLVDGDYAAVIAALADEVELAPQLELWRIVALRRLLRFDEAAARLRALLADDARARAIHRELLALLRTDVDGFGALVREAAGAAQHRALLVEAWTQAFQMSRGDDAPARALLGGLVELAADALAPNAAVELRLLRARVRAELGMRARAREDYEAALSLLDALPQELALPSLGLREPRARVLFELAILALRSGDLEAARAATTTLLASTRDVDLYEDMLRARAEFAPLLPVIDGAARRDDP